MNKGYYSVVQYCPDASRMEVANIGILLFCPDLDFIDIRMSNDNNRICRFFGERSFDHSRVNAAKSAFENSIILQKERFTSLKDLEQFIDTRANQIILTGARSLRVGDDPSRLLDQLYEELVEERPIPPSRTSVQSLCIPCFEKRGCPAFLNPKDYGLSVGAPMGPWILVNGKVPKIEICDECAEPTIAGIYVPLARSEE